MTHAARRQAERRGRFAETVAAALLVAKGWKILARRRQLPMIEVDIVARRRNVVAVVEVKYRATRGEACMALTPMAASRLQAAARQIAAETGLSARVDLVAVAPWCWPLHLPRVVG